ncbi:hypothetical protein [uncultured Thomasclavelia sp.]|uniref:hypothetical protein n=1 Tax=uncultured Thomasclavelia sp. TaxID=3025759 RepID=UPI0025EFC536|nr:hypothetical protein [uncultured Thomasclavelia sp.]
MSNSRIDKYRELREGIKDEVGINRENQTDNIDESESVEDDDFLLSVNRAFRSERNEPDIEDTLTEAKTFAQMRQESSEELNRALRSAKSSVGKATHYNTRMDILNKIREPEKQVIRLNKFDNVSTSEFSKGFFVNDETELKTEEKDTSDKKKMTLLERLASMSPEEDVKKAKMAIGEESFIESFEDDELDEESLNEASKTSIEQTKSLEDMLRQIKEKDQREVAKALSQRKEANDKNIKVEENNFDQKNDEIEEIDDKETKSKSDRVATILNYIIIFLVIVFVGLCAMIGYQLFF